MIIIIILNCCFLRYYKLFSLFKNIFMYYEIDKFIFKKKKSIQLYKRHTTKNFKLIHTTKIEIVKNDCISSAL
jgi:hypothetical protein